MKSYNFGDIVWANRFSNDEERENIPLGHRTGPFVILKQVGKKYVSLYCSHVFPKDHRDFRYILKINRDNYATFTSGDILVYVSRMKILNEEQIHRLICELQNEDLDNLIRRLEIVKREKGYDNYDEFIYDIPFDVKDVIANQDGVYLVIDKNDKNLKCLPLVRKDDGKYQVTIDGAVYCPLFDKICIFDETVRFKRLTFIDDVTLNSVLKYYKSYLEYQEDVKILQRGSLVVIDGDLFYVYGEMKQEFLACGVDSTFDKKLNHITINGVDYYADFSNDISFNPNYVDYSIISLASDDEKDKVKDERKTYSKTNQKPKTKLFGEIDPILAGDIVKGSWLEASSYLVLWRRGEKLLCATLIDALSGNFENLEWFKTKNFTRDGKMDDAKFKEILLAFRDYETTVYSRLGKVDLKQLEKKFSLS